MSQKKSLKNLLLAFTGKIKMCGFVGFISNNLKKYKKSQLQGFELIKYRGPNESLFVERDWYLAGFHRLAIQDLTDKGSQPMRYKNYELVFNGEIYNFKSIRNQLIRLGYSFTSNSDTETLIKSYAHWGKKCVNKFNGMFSFAVFDSIKKTVSIFRDRLGVKPLYFSHQKGSYFAFSSEIKTFKSFLNFESERSEVIEYLVFKSLLGNGTLVKNIKSIEAGQFLVYEFINDRFKIHNYYSDNEQIYQYSFNDASRRLEEILIDSVRQRLISDVEIGLQLSGGIDSSLIAAIIQTHFPKNRLNSYSVSFPNSKYDESYFQKIVANQYSINHHEIMFTQEDFSSYLDKAVWLEEFPIVHPSSLAILKLSEFAKKDVSVLIGGEGADEIFCGYPKYSLLRYRKILSMLSILNPFSAVMLPNYGRFRTLKDWLSGNHNFEQILVSQLQNKELMKIFSPVSYNLRTNRENFLKNYSRNVSLSVLDQKTSLRMLLRRFDRMTMGASIEGRVPFCDFRITEFGNSLDLNFKILKNQKKFILKKVAEKYLPKELIYRKKMGFSTPIYSWFINNKELKDRIDLLRSRNFLEREIVDNSKLEKIIDSKVTENQFLEIIWPLLSYEMWHQRFIN